MRDEPKIELVAIGDELLNGLRTNSHLTYLGERLEARGLGISWAGELRDEPADIRDGLQRALKRAGLVIVTGGLGPTRDDFTVECAAAALGRRIVQSAEVEAAIRKFFEERQRQPSGNNWKQCAIIEGAEILPNAFGTAPGQWIEAGGRYLVLLPGPPRELQPLFESEVLPRLASLGWVRQATPPLTLRTMGVGESQVATHLDPLFAAEGDRIRVAYCAHLGYVDVRISPASEAVTEGHLRALGEKCHEKLGQGFLGYGTPEVACLILKQLRSLNKTLAVAESCTGGLLASRFTDIAGASKAFKGGIVCYNNEVKESLLGVPGCLLEQHGAVSAECAVAMAMAVAEMFESDYGLAITGYAGPEGGREPAGTVYLGYHSPVGVWSRRVVLPGTRVDVKERAVYTSLDFIRRKLEKYQIFDLLESLKC